MNLDAAFDDLISNWDDYLSKTDINKLRSTKSKYINKTENVSDSLKRRILLRAGYGENYTQPKK